MLKLLFVVNQSATTRPPDVYAYSRNFSFVLDLYQPMVKLLVEMVEVVRVVTGEWGIGQGSRFRNRLS